jgi:crossover junction endodeoxyribonuclease RusA
MSRPDIDNTAKGILDSLNGVAYIDDGQVYRLTVEKWYVGPEDQVGTWIEVVQ